MDNSHRPTNEDSMRRAIFALLNAHKVSPDTALNALAQCQSHVRNRVTIEEMVRACGMTTSGFLSNEHLEIYYNLKQGRHAVGYVSKGWEVGPAEGSKPREVNLNKVRDYLTSQSMIEE